MGRGERRRRGPRRVSGARQLEPGGATGLTALTVPAKRGADSLLCYPPGFRTSTALNLLRALPV